MCAALQLTWTSNLTEGRGKEKMTHLLQSFQLKKECVKTNRQHWTVLELWIYTNIREYKHDISGQSEKNDAEQMHYRENKMNGRQRKQGMKRDEETVCRDLKGEEGWRKAMEKELVIERLAAQSVSRLFSRWPWRRDLSGATSFWAERCRSGRPPGEKVWHDH